MCEGEIGGEGSGNELNEESEAKELSEAIAPLCMRCQVSTEDLGEIV